MSQARGPASGRAGVLREGDLGGAVDGDHVVVVEADQAAEPELARECAGLAGHALHEAAVAADRVDGIVEEGRVGTFVARRHVGPVRRGLRTMRSVSVCSHARLSLFACVARAG